jgi:uncharacterized membrane protein YphA (DoxX/SURF4 family)
VAHKTKTTLTNRDDGAGQHGVKPNRQSALSSLRYVPALRTVIPSSQLLAAASTARVGRQAAESQATNHRFSPVRFCRELWQAWDQFWFTAVEPYTLALIRILAGGMLFYTHLIWTIDLQGFLGPHSWVTTELVRKIHQGSYAQSYLWYVESPTLLVALHIAALVIFAMLTIGLFTRAASILAAVITLSYCHRLPGSLFGLDQINAMLAMYLAIAPCGAAYSFDRWLANRKAGEGGANRTSVSINIALRLIQIHMCVIYLFGGIGKMRGEMWWDGSALWYAIANFEYQSLNITWLVRFPWLIALLTHVTVFWETFYAFLIWPRYTRPLMLIAAFFVHSGIAIFLGMPTFGIAMLIGNLAFLSPSTTQLLVQAPQWLIGALRRR